jgi:hypothetical protein
MESAKFSNVHSETSASPAGEVAEVAAPVQAERQNFLRILDWTGRVLLLGVVVIGGWSTWSGLRQLLDSSSRSTVPLHSSIDPQPPSTWEALHSWTSPGEWKFAQSDPASISQQHLIPWPEDAESVATRYDDRNRVVVELLSTLWPPDRLRNQWQAAGFVVRELESPPSDDLPADDRRWACELTRSSEVFLVWSVPPSTPGRVTIVCSRCESSNPLENEAP